MAADLWGKHRCRSRSLPFISFLTFHILSMKDLNFLSSMIGSDHLDWSDSVSLSPAAGEGWAGKLPGGGDVQGAPGVWCPSWPCQRKAVQPRVSHTL